MRRLSHKRRAFKKAGVPVLFSAEFKTNDANNRHLNRRTAWPTMVEFWLWRDGKVLYHMPVARNEWMLFTEKDIRINKKICITSERFYSDKVQGIVTGKL